MVDADLSSLATDDRETGAALALGAAAALAALLPLLRAMLRTPAERVLARAEAIIVEKTKKAKKKKTIEKKVRFLFSER